MLRWLVFSDDIIVCQRFKFNTFHSVHFQRKSRNISFVWLSFLFLNTRFHHQESAQEAEIDMEEVRGPRKLRKRSRSESSDDSTSSSSERSKLKKTTNGFCNNKSSKLADDQAVYGRRIPYFGENSINDILKVVSLQSFSNPRLSLLNDGERDVQKLSSRAESDCLSDSSSEELSRKERSDSFSEETGGSGEHSNLGLPSNKSRGRRNDFKNGSSGITEAIGKDQRYWEKRQRNNASAKRSRDARRVRELETQIRAEYLEDENYRLKVENEVLREENARLLKTIERLKQHTSNKD